MSIPASFALDAYARAAGIGAGAATPPAGGIKDNGGGFGDILKQALDEAVDTAKSGEQKIAAVTAGREGNIVDVVTAVAEAEATLQTVVTVRDKVITAYQEIMRMPI
ncbi:MAG: flagellar hook-basal body complex protein FliE [Parvibaculum sp.]|uniref:flagellar hook-basal body complex protein FliE n=1 Tax=Parvibaculum sp. TaxID=2024848 RepID=UPI0034A0A5AB